MNKLILAWLAVVLILLTGCGDTTEKKKTTAEKPKTFNPLEGHLKAIKKAKDAQQKIQQAAKRQRKAIDDINHKKKSTNKKDG